MVCIDVYPLYKVITIIEYHVSGFKPQANYQAQCNRTKPTSTE